MAGSALCQTSAQIKRKSNHLTKGWTTHCCKRFRPSPGSPVLGVNDNEPLTLNAEGGTGIISVESHIAVVLNDIHDPMLLSESKVKPFETTALAPSTLPRPLHISWATICLYSKKDKCWRQPNQWTCLQASKRDSQELCWKVKNRWQLTTVPCFMLPNRSSLAFFSGRPSS